MKTRFLYPILIILIVSVMNVPAARPSGDSAIETSVVKGRVTDVEGTPVRGAMVFAYKNPDIRTSADFISAPADADGLYRMVMPSGKYWLVARFKRTEGFGPLMQGDKHSGDPVEIELASPGETDMDFVVADLKDAIRMKRESLERPIKISGRILDEEGKPVAEAYAVAYSGEISRFPDFLSASVDTEGRYTLYVPAGKYSIGAARTFPPGHNYVIQGEMSIESDRTGMDIVMKSPRGR